MIIRGWVLSLARCNFQGKNDTNLSAHQKPLFELNAERRKTLENADRNRRAEIQELFDTQIRSIIRQITRQLDWMEINRSNEHVVRADRIFNAIEACSQPLEITCTEWWSRRITIRQDQDSGILHEETTSQCSESVDFEVTGAAAGGRQGPCLRSETKINIGNCNFED